MRISSLFVAMLFAATAVLAPLSAQAAEISDSPQFRYRAHRTRGILRPSHRSVERTTRAYRKVMAAERREFQRKLHRIQEVRREMLGN